MIDSYVTEKERNTPAPQAEQRPTDAWQLCGKHLYVMKLPFSHSLSVIKPSQAMKTARHQNGGRCKSYGNRYAACSSGMSVNIKANRNKGTAAPRTGRLAPSGTCEHGHNRRGCSFLQHHKRDAYSVMFKEYPDVVTTEQNARDGLSEVYLCR
ncbi:hypothetical protein SDC9_132126 [bioreactor metagenome]|uniref:Uncharacterized protein n=1 Tax=bioreactor metagenome TaxID=1076179 RepID=A0A645D747_9ZZZZ